ncbi:MAG: adenylate/guanylate cyclase domain-containing protein [Cyclobacteriaceae bacterium]|nr:adenylate/guanylate cyclase domain-containing protein [Cyclobacteriaceae bacterium]
MEIRRLATIMFTDIAGYTALMEHDEQGTMVLLTRHKQVLEICVEKYGGNNIKFYGDGSLSIFTNAIDSIYCALEIQKELRKDPVVPLRIGLHAGEIFEKDGDIFGSNVNLTARIQTVGVPGSILISRNLYEKISNKQDFQFTLLGSYNLKNVSADTVIYAMADQGLSIPEKFPDQDKQGQFAENIPPNNLPETLTSFIGRKKEINQIKDLIRSSRLCTLTGAGGIGKTRLAVELAKSLFEEFTNGIWFIDLASVSSFNNLIDTCLGTIQLKGRSDKSREENLFEYLISRKVLMILDNCEHIIDESAQLIKLLLKRTVSPHFLLTSRERLNIQGERPWPLKTLSLPYPQKGLIDSDAADIRNYEAIQLFIDRANIVTPGFRPSENEWRAITEICRHLDGIPLAIELAAARVRILQPELLLERLKTTPGLLRSYNRDTASRQKTLEKTIEWSYDLLSAEERILFNRLSVFPDSFDLESAENVCSDPPLKKETIVDIFESLFEKSLISHMHNGRYRLLELIKQFGRKKLNEVAQWFHMVERLYGYMLNLSSQAYHEQLSDSEKWMNNLKNEHVNLNNVLEWTKNDPAKNIELAGYLGWFWFVFPYRIHTVIENLFENLEKYRNPDLIRARALASYGKLSFNFFADTDSIKCVEESIKILKKSNKPAELALAYLTLGQLYLDIDDFIKGKKALDQSEKLAKYLGDRFLQLSTRGYISYGYITQSHPELAEPVVKKNIEEANQLNLKWELFKNRHLYGDCALLQESYSLAYDRYQVALLSALELNNLYQVAYEIQGMAMSLAGMEQLEKALLFNGAALNLFDELNMNPHQDIWWKRLIEKHLGKARLVLGMHQAEILENEGRIRPFKELYQQIIIK